MSVCCAICYDVPIMFLMLLLLMWSYIVYLFMFCVGLLCLFVLDCSFLSCCVVRLGYSVVLFFCVLVLRVCVLFIVFFDCVCVCAILLYCVLSLY